MFAKKKYFYSGKTIFNILPPSVKILKNKKAKCKASLKKHPNKHSFYCVNECFVCNEVFLCFFLGCKENSRV
jgi:hypothetical protein